MPILLENHSCYLEFSQQPGPEVAEQLSVYQASLKEKTRQMKAMASELNMYQAQVGDGDMTQQNATSPYYTGILTFPTGGEVMA